MTENRPHIFFLCFANPMQSSRVLRVAQSAKDKGFQVFATGFSDMSVSPPSAQTLPFEPKNVGLIEQKSARYHKIFVGLIGALGWLAPSKTLKLMLLKAMPNIGRQYRHSKNWLETQTELTKDDILYVCHWQAGLSALWLQQKYGCKIYYDLAELPCVEFTYKRFWSFLVPQFIRILEHRIVSQASKISSVIPDPSDYFLRELALQNISSIFVPNIPYRLAEQVSVKPSKGDLKQRSNSFIYIGGIRPARGLEVGIDALTLLPPEIKLAYQGYGEASYIAELQQRAVRMGVQDRLSILPPVSPDGIVPALRGYRGGLSLLDTEHQQLQMAQPNKIFQYLAAEIPVLVDQNSLLAKQGTDILSINAVDATNPSSVANALMSCRNISPSQPVSLDKFLSKIKAQEFSELFKRK